MQQNERNYVQGIFDKICGNSNKRKEQIYVRRGTGESDFLCTEIGGW